MMSGCAEYEVVQQGPAKPATVSDSLKIADYENADALVESNTQEQTVNDKILYYFDKGSIQQIIGNYKESTKNLHEADLLIDALYTKSATAEVSSFFSNDLSLPYEGEDFEQVMVNVIKSLNFMYLGDFEGARVEVKKADEKLKLLSDKMEGKNEYKEDAFARYISAFCYEERGELNDALIDYKKSLETYEQYKTNYGTAVPDGVKKDILRLSEALHLSEQYADFKEKFGFMPYTKQADLKGRGEVMLVIYDGQAPDKIDKEAVPVFVDKGSLVSSVEVVTEEDKNYTSFMAEDITKIAIKNLAQKMDLIQAKGLARAVVKEVAVAVAKEAGKELLKNLPFGSFIADAAGDAYKSNSELADTRSWKTLPSRFHLVRFTASGTQKVDLKMHMTDGSVREKVIKIKVDPGAKKVIPVYCFR
jgi:hypothetical protein